MSFHPFFVVVYIWSTKVVNCGMEGVIFFQCFGGWEKTARCFVVSTNSGPRRRVDPET